MVKKGFWIFSVLLIFICSCGPSPEEISTQAAESWTKTPTLTATSTLTQTPTIRPSSTPTTTSTFTSTFTPTIIPTLSALQTQGPYLVYLKASDNGNELVLLDEDGQGEKVIPLPTNASSGILPYMLSPDGKWLAYYTGSAGTCMSPTASTDRDLTLKLLDTTSGQTRIVSHLLSADYPNGFDEAFRELSPDIQAVVGGPESLQNALVCGIRTLAWAPSGQKLAFAGQMDGLSSDLYTYDFQSGSIQRLSRGPEEIAWINWSPDGEWILDGSYYWAGDGETFDVFASKVDGSAVRQFSTNSSFSRPLWSGPHTFFKYESDMGSGDNHLQLVDLAKDTRTMIWTGAFTTLAASDINNWIALYAAETMDDSTDGPVVINLDTMEKIRVKTSDDTHVYGRTALEFLGLSQDKMFLLQDQTDGTLYYLSITGSLTSTGIVVPGNLWGGFNLSPDRKTIVGLADGQVNEYSTSGELLKTIRLPANLANIQVDHLVMWRPDSSGFFFVGTDYQSQTSSLFALDLSNELVTLEDASVPDYLGNDAIWVAQK